MLIHENVYQVLNLPRVKKHRQGHHAFQHQNQQALLLNLHNLAYLSITIDAPIEILKERFLERVELSKRDNTKPLSVSTIEDFHFGYTWHKENNIDPDAIVFDSSKLTSYEIVEEIKKLLS